MEEGGRDSKEKTCFNFRWYQLKLDLEFIAIFRSLVLFPSIISRLILCVHLVTVFLGDSILSALYLCSFHQRNDNR